MSQLLLKEEPRFNSRLAVLQRVIALGKKNFSAATVSQQLGSHLTE